jgi:hypothetical protein
MSPIIKWLNILHSYITTKFVKKKETNYKKEAAKAASYLLTQNEISY